MSERLRQVLTAVQPVDTSLAPQGQAHLDDLTKPRGSLGRLEEVALRLYLISGGSKPSVDPARIFTIAGDHGVAAEGVSLFPQEVSRQMVLNFANGGAGINVLARTAGIGLSVVDAGTVGGTYPEHPALIQRKVRPGTDNLAVGPAMSVEDCTRALELGIDLANMAADEGCRAVGTGDMGIANTTPSTALFCAYLGLDPEKITGPGTGLAADGLRRKIEVIRRGLAANQTDVASGDPLRILAALGGLEIAALSGLIIGAAGRRMAVAVDGFISTAAYVSAWKLCPAVADYCFLSHASAEPGYASIMQTLKADPLLHLGLRLGEGTGAAMALFVMRSAAAIFNEMATFSGAGVCKA
ncbi:nicotinate-nucleotide-dimethylbenzimidazole phosphoribosyltransferase [Desulfocurvibacter africanus PCS]|uniref:Nicotinate-nucleotide--dimethylbenzimidazole phosphoribosyltransferase n=1 Tax=Desulfocurvibacter africanus PCS TaxID=1262666 RepID=M5PT35_DESAF|nr:nicotinate-nucleotide--dimethylbenzimidazole phosphoribosyltransferase [Desulfocurvibacter africanus]EMG37215.1 nicotinate-nucleotide-dimethylbenzimidazole phosphoribosyltransferase [Desulfocurvibacter africanus PCS]